MFSELELDTSTFLATCYRDSSLRAMVSVEARARQFRQQLEVHDPHVDPERAFLMWLRTLLQQGQISAASARQYLTYHRMSKIPPQEAFRRATLQIPPPKRAEPTTISQVQVFNAVYTPPLSRAAVALALQWSTGCRWSDLERLRSCDIRFLASGDIMVTFLGGKTDLHWRGQALMLPAKGKYIGLLRRWVAHRQSQSPEGALFQGLKYTEYNTFLRQSLHILSHGVRRSALKRAAEVAGQASAQLLARHRNPTSTEGYLPHHLWQTTVQSKEATQTLQ